MYTGLVLVAIFSSLVAAVPAGLDKRQGVTAIIPPPDPAPSGCLVSYPTLFGIIFQNLTTLADSSDPPTTVTSPAAPTTVTSVPTTVTSVPTTVTATVPAVSEIAEEQPSTTVTLIVPAVSEIADGQPQAPTVQAVSQLSEGHPQAPKSTATAVIQISDGQPEALTPRAAPVSQFAKRQGPTVGGFQFVVCNTSSTLILSLTAGVLTDSEGRTGYIASDYQLQFDDPPQSGAIFTAGFSVCINETLALGGTTVFWGCLSGSFYNIYDRNFAPQCQPINLIVAELISCP
jgi:Yeast PIR protein repeat